MPAIFSPAIKPIAKNGASGATFFVSLVSQANEKIFQANPTLAGGDIKISLDGGALNNLAALPTVSPAGSKMVSVVLSQAETNADNLTIVFSDAAGAEWCDLVLNLQTGPAIANITQIDGLATNGNNATLNLKQLNIVNSAGSALVASSTGSNGSGINASGNGTGYGFLATAGATGHGMYLLGGATSGIGLYAMAQTSGQGAAFTGAGNGGGILSQGAGVGTGLHCIGGSDGDGIDAEGNGIGSGMGLQGGNGGFVGDGRAGLTCKGGIGGIAANFVASNDDTSKNGNGIVVTGSGSGHGIFVQAGPTGNGVFLKSGTTSGDALLCFVPATGSGHGINAIGVGTAKHGIVATGGAGAGSHGIKGQATSGSDGSGMYLSGTGAGNGLTAFGGVSGAAVSTSIPSAFFDQSNGVESGLTFRQFMRLSAGVLFGKSNGGRSTTIHFRNTTDTVNRVTAVVDGFGNRTNVTLDPS